MHIFRTIYKRIISFSILLFLFPAFVKPANIIFDMDGVLVKQSRFSACFHIGFSTFLGIYNPFSLNQKLFDFLDLLEPRYRETPKAMHHGKILPQLMCDWLTGAKTNAEIRTIIEQGLEQHDDFFYSNSQKTVIAGLCEFMFTPEKMIHAIYPVKDTLKLVKKCKRRPDKYGNENRIFILTNWDPESFSLLYKRKSLRKLFNRCDGIVVSGSVNLIKPDPEIYYYLLNHFSIDPTKELTVFVDDTPANVHAAIQCGLHGIHCHKLNTNAVKKEFYELGIL